MNIIYWTEGTRREEREREKRERPGRRDEIQTRQSW